jgi:uncharacterized protein (TIGR00251 family)
MLRSVNGGCILSVRLHPGAKHNAITGVQSDALKISITTAPTDGRANAALVAFLAERLNIPRASIELISGPRNPSKAFRITGLTAAEARSRLLSDLA